MTLILPLKSENKIISDNKLDERKETAEAQHELLSIFTRSGRHESTNAFTYSRDIEETQNAKYHDKIPPILSIINDCGSTTSARSLLTFIAFGRLFTQLELDHLICISHSDGYSLYNKIEIAWSDVELHILPQIIKNDIQEHMQLYSEI